LGNEAFPIGFAIAPTERAELFSTFAELMDKLGIFEYRQKPILTDMGTGLAAYAREAGHPHHFLCYRHILENIGSGTWVAEIARRLLFTSSEAEYESLVYDAFADVNALLQKGMTDKGSVDRFRATFGNTAETSLATFRPQALWIRAIWGVTTCSNHIERLHRELNSAVENMQSLFHRLGCICQALVNRFEAACRMKHDQAMKLARRFSRIDGRKDVCAKAQAGLCGWSDIYSKRFGIPGFPCPHTVFDSQQLNWDHHLKFDHDPIGAGAAENICHAMIKTVITVQSNKGSVSCVQDLGYLIHSILDFFKLSIIRSNQ
jgi:hypothetical protein